jgi:hypothetical protein
MRPSLTAVVNRQQGIFARHQAISAGYTAREFDQLTRGTSSPWVRVRYGVYAERLGWAARSEEQRALILDDAALLVCDSGTVLSHSSAARRLGMPLYNAADGLTHVTRLRTDGRALSRIQAGVKHHCGSLEDIDVCTHDGRPVTDPVRTVLDLTCEFGYRTGLVAADAILHAGTTKEELVQRAEGSSHHTRHPAMCAVARDADGRAESPIETLGRITLVAVGISDLKLQFTITLRTGRSATVDLYSPALHHVFECDGRMKYRTQVDARGVTVRPEDVVWLEKQREDAIRGQDFGVSRLVWRDTMPENLEQTRARLWQEIEDQGAARRRTQRGA